MVTKRTVPLANLWRIAPDDEEAVREHHLGGDDGGVVRCVICRLLATIDALREELARARSDD